MWVVVQFLESAKCFDLAVFEHDDFVCQVQEIYGMGHKNSSFILQHTLEDMLKDLFTNIGIQSGNGVIHHDNVTVGIDCSGKTDASLLTTREVDSFLSNFGRITCR